MLHEEKRDSGTERVCNKPGVAAVLSILCTQVVHEQTKEVTVYAAWDTKPFGRVHEPVFGHQGV